MRSMTWWAHVARPYWVDLFHAHFKVRRCRLILSNPRRKRLVLIP